MPNIQNINRMIALIDELYTNKPGGFAMATWRSLRFEAPIDSPLTTCNTVACLAGWAEHFIETDSGGKISRTVAPGYFPCLWFGIDDRQQGELFHMMNSDHLTLSKFDLLPAKVAHRTVRILLEILRDRNTVDWDHAYELALTQINNEPAP